MGKPYAKELERLSEVYDWANKIPIDNLSKFVEMSAKTPLYVIGSGGSFSATTFTSILHQHVGIIARCLTPLEFLEYENIDKNSSVLIITAGGNNTDILSSFEKAVSLKLKNIGILCASVNNKLTRRASKIANVLVHAVKLPTGRDGFLATNSLVATLIWLTRAYIESFSLPYEIPRFSELDIKTKKEFKKFQNKETLVLLYDNWGKTAAIDAESKLIEAGLVNVQMADYRNFAHGRHNWLDKNKEKTCLIALITPQCESLATKTLKLIPEYTPTTSFSTNFDGPIASIALLIQVLYLVKFFGNIRKIDPGRPGVAIFGRKIYHLPIPKNISSSLTDFEKLVLRRKFGNADLSNSKTKSRVKSLYNFIDNMSKQKFGAVIFDYDGTLCDSECRFTKPSKPIGELLTNLLQNEIVIGIATGRGKSVRIALQKSIPKQYWSKLFIGYYNCADIATMDDNESPKTNSSLEKNLSFFLDFLKKQNILSNGVKITERPNQITLESESLNAIDLIENIESIDKTKLEKVRIVESSHSVDLLSQNVSKLNLCKFIKKKIPSKYQILCIGDRGKWPGNDYELLKTEFSFSVNETSDNVKNCWNILPKNILGECGVCEYFKYTSMKHGYFLIKLSMRI